MTSFWTRLFGGGDDSAAPSAAPAPDAGLDHAAVLERARAELELKTAAHDRTWALASAAWAVDLQQGEIVFTAPDGRRVTAPVQVIGTLDPDTGAWMWGWDHPSVAEPIGRAAAAVRDYGAERGLAELTTRVVDCDEARAWEFTALAAHLAGAQGGYRGAAGATLVFMTFGTVTLSAGDSAPTPPADFGAGLTPVDDPAPEALVRAYLGDIFAIETAHRDRPDGERGGHVHAAVAAMQPVYDRYWRRDDDYWRPASVSSRPESDLSLTHDWRTYSRGPDRWRVAYVRDIGVRLPRAYDVERFPDGLKIVDALF
ncbi:DUF6882 domain-containing protein [Methylopila musalis]|uniref:DUF6882 domain-containing protein n=1 Tax=Methylopila musalis TaxID=1134781 RepID=A0ABW3ZBI9_9HYPH